MFSGVTSFNNKLVGLLTVTSSNIISWVTFINKQKNMNNQIIKVKWWMSYSNPNIIQA